MTNSELILMGLISEGILYGYQIEQEIERRGMRQWTEIAFSSIYYVLNKIEAAGWVTNDIQSESDRPARKVYRLTSLGQQVYRQAVYERLASPRLRSGDFDLGLANLAALPGQRALEAITQYRAALQIRLEQVQQKWKLDGGENLPSQVTALFDHSLAMITAELKWVTSWLNDHQSV